METLIDYKNIYDENKGLNLGIRDISSYKI